MGIKDFMRRRANELGDARADFELGCEILGRPSDPTSVSQRRDRMVAGREERERRQAGNHKGGFHVSQHGFVDDHPVTFALGWGSKEGHTLLADGHISNEVFRESTNHDHYGPGAGPHNNGSLRKKYTGPDA